MERIQTRERLREIMGQPLPIVPKKIHRQLNAKAIEFIQKASLMFISASDMKGRSTVAPKGDPAGFVQIVNATTLRIPERKGNRLLMSLQNLLENDQIGLVFLVPGTIELLRVPEGATTALPPTKEEIEKLLATAPSYGIEIKVPGH